MPRFLPLVCSLALVAFAAEGQSRLSTDIIDTYTEMIAAKPGSSDLYLSRATEYASQGLLSPALTDLNDALRLAPEGDKELRFEILKQRSAILEQQRDYEAALKDIVAAEELRPDVPSMLLSKARIETKLGQYTEAREDYNRFRRFDTRSSEALFGLAEVAAREGNSDNALAYASEAVEVAPRDGRSYVRRAAIYNILGRSDEAIAEYIRAIGYGDEGAAEALQCLADMSYKGYPAVMAGFDKAITDNPSAGILYYLRATIAQAHDHHRTAMTDLRRIEGIGPFASGGIGELLAESLIALNLYDEAVKALDAVAPDHRGDSWHVMKSRVLFAKGMNEQALDEAVSALMINPDNVDAMAAKARALIALGRDEDAAAQLSTLIMTDPTTLPEAYFLKASTASSDDIKKRLLGEAELLPFDPDDPLSLRGFALLNLGRADEAEIWASTIRRFASAHDGVADFYAACLFAQAGKNEEALKALDAALDAGYDNLYLIEADTTPYISITPLRSDPKFASLIDSYFPPIK